MASFQEIPQFYALSISVQMMPNGEHAILSVAGSTPETIHLPRAALLALQRQIAEQLSKPPQGDAQH